MIRLNHFFLDFDLNLLHVRSFGHDFFGEHDLLAQLFYWLIHPKYMTDHRGTTISSCRGHGLPAHHLFWQPCPDYMTGNRGTRVSSFRGRPPPKATKLWCHTSFESLFSLPRLETHSLNVGGGLCPPQYRPHT